MAGKFRKAVQIVGFVSTLGAAVGAAEGRDVVAALPGASTPAAPTGDARPVQGWVAFCERQPAECALDLSEPETITLTRRLWQRILTVNADVNNALRPVTDEAHHGILDRWDLAEDGAGDCEDYQLLKRKLLVDAGLPRRALRMSVVLDEKGEGHAVLMVRTDRGDFILDNKVPAVLPWHRTGYVFVKREGQDGPNWTSLGGAMSPAVTANR